jgi:hypothetical protein
MHNTRQGIARPAPLQHTQTTTTSRIVFTSEDRLKGITSKFVTLQGFASIRI